MKASDTTDGPTPEEPAGDTMTPEQAFAVISELVSHGLAIEFMPWSESVGVNIRLDIEQRLRHYDTDPDPLVAFSRAYRAFREGAKGNE